MNYSLLHPPESVMSLKELCVCVIVRALLQQRSLDSDQLQDTLPDYVPTTLKECIVRAYKTNTHQLPIILPPSASMLMPMAGFCTIRGTSITAVPWGPGHGVGVHVPPFAPPMTGVLQMPGIFQGPLGHTPPLPGGRMSQHPVSPMAGISHIAGIPPLAGVSQSPLVLSPTMAGIAPTHRAGVKQTVEVLESDTPRSQ